MHEIICGAVRVEREIFYEAIACDLIGMNNDLMTEYIEFVTERPLVALGHSMIFDYRTPRRGG